MEFSQTVFGNGSFTQIGYKPDMDEEELTPPVEDESFRKVFEGRSEFLDAAGPFWSDSRRPKGPVGRKPQLSFISKQLLPMFESFDGPVQSIIIPFPFIKAMITVTKIIIM